MSEVCQKLVGAVENLTDVLRYTRDYAEREGVSAGSTVIPADFTTSSGISKLHLKDAPKSMQDIKSMNDFLNDMFD